MTDEDDEIPRTTLSEPAEATDAVALGATLNGRYTLHRLLGRGGMGVVYHARDTLKGRDVALKMLRRQVLSSTSLSLFKAEFITLATLRHPNIAEVHDFAQLQGAPDCFFTMELIAGKNALDATEGADFERVLDIALQVLRALAYLHTRGIVHLDLKPANVLVTPTGVARVLDFGIARSSASAGGRYATPLYMAPELSRAAAEPDRRADLYSLGVSLFQLLFRRMPLPADRGASGPYAELASFVLTPAELERARPWIPDVLRRLMATDPADRYRSAGDVIETIERASGRRIERETEQTRDSYVASASFVGKPLLATLLERLHERMQSGRAEALVLLGVGPSGSGKSRLRDELRQQCQIAQYLWFDAQCYAEAPAPNGVWEAIGTQVSAFSGTEQPALSALALAEHVCDLLLSLGKPTIISVDDLQWIDQASLDLFELVIERLSRLQRSRSIRLAFLCTCRDEIPENVAQAVRRLHATGALLEVPLRPLDAAQVTELVHSMLGPTNLQPELATALTRATGGNALLVGEMLRAWVRDASIRQCPTGWTFERQPSLHEIEGQLSHVLGDRLAALGARQKRLLAALSVFGRPMDLDLLGRFFGIERDGSLELLEEVRRTRVVYLSGERVQFSATRWSALVHETVSAEERADLHRALAALLAGHTAPALVAFHYERGRELRLAATWYGRAALESFRRRDMRQVLALAEKALAHGSEDQELGRVCSVAAEAARALGDSRAMRFAERAIGLLPQGSDDWLRATQAAIAVFVPPVKTP